MLLLLHYSQKEKAINKEMKRKVEQMKATTSSQRKSWKQISWRKTTTIRQMEDKLTRWQL
jgi:hypothetical protein